ncbi:MAG: lipoprotein [Snodgrassella sp.]|jgi:predicted small lipoprotein YifL|nr:lipoprotein [Snodgrassella sp.]
MSRLLILCFLASSLLTACGYKGDLYLPQEKGKAKFGPVQTGLSIEPIDQRKLPEND